MWSSPEFATDKEGTASTATLLSHKAGFESVPLPAEDITLRVETVSARYSRFYAAQLAKSNYNPIERQLNSCGAYALVIEREKVLLAGMVCLPHTLYIEGLGQIRAVLSTHLLVHSENRHVGLARSIIMGAVKEGHERKIEIGYHWIPETKSKAAVKSISWYRPLLLEQASKQGYDLLPNTSYELPLVPAEYSLTPTVPADFLYASASAIRLQPTLAEFILLSNLLTFFTLRHNDVIVGVLAYRPFTIVKPKLTCYAAQLCYFDVLQGHAVAGLALLFARLKERGFVALHGVFMSQLSYAIATLKLALTPYLHLDFYNLAHPGLLNTNCALLYI